MYSQIAANKRKTWLIMILFVLFIGALAWVFSMYVDQPLITPFVLAGAALYVLITYFSGSSMALAVNGAQQIEKQDNPRLWRMIENLTITNGLPMPKVYIMEDAAPNAFATGRNPQNSAVCVTTGLMDIMEDSELEGVLAHELGHIQNYDIRVSMIAFALVAVIGIMADFFLHMLWFRNNDDESPGGGNPFFMLIGIVAALVAPIIASLIQLAISRRREYLADATGALTTRYPEGLASALEKIGEYGSALHKQNTSTAHFFFANPLKSGGIANLFSTHPPIEERVARLREMGDKA